MKKNKVLLLTLMPLEPVKSGYQNTVFNLYNELKNFLYHNHLTSLDCLHLSHNDYKLFFLIVLFPYCR